MAISQILRDRHGDRKVNQAMGFDESVEQADESFGEPSATARDAAAAAQQEIIDKEYVKTVGSNARVGIRRNTSEDLLRKFKQAMTQKKKNTKYDKKNAAYQKRSDARTDRATELDLEVGDRVAKGDRTSLKNPSRTAHKKRTVDKLSRRYKHGNNLPRLPESVEQVDESKIARMMALITALGATYGLEDEARAFARQIQQNIHNAQNAEPNPGRPDPVTPGNMNPGSDRVMRPPVDEIAPAIAAVGRGVAKGVGAVAKGVGSMAKTAGTKMAINKMQKDISDDEANEASTTSKILKGAPGAPDGRPKSMREAVNVQSIKDETEGAVRSGNPREMKRVSDTIAKRISDLMDLRGTAGEEVDAEIKKALPVLKKAQMMLRDMMLRDKRKLGEDAYDDMSQEINAHAEKFAVKGKDLERYVGKNITLWIEGSSNPPYQSTYKIEAGNNGQGVTIDGEYYGPEDFVDHNSAADYSWKSEKAADQYEYLQSKRDELDEAKEKTRIDKKCWKGKKIGNPKTKVKGGVRVNNCVPKE
jgi:hypothetical protein